MKYIHEFRDPDLAKRIIAKINVEAIPSFDYQLMEFCGGHTHAIFRYGLPDLLPKNIHLIHGPGCPVCVLPSAKIEAAIELLRTHDVILCIYSDLLRVPSKGKNSLLIEKANGADVRLVYSPQDAMQIAQDNPHRNVVFFAIGFETTTPATAHILKKAKDDSVNNFSIFCNHVLTPAALEAILNIEDEQSPTINGIIGPSHVSKVYEKYAKSFRIPIVIAGFEPLDVLQSVLLLIRQINRNEYTVENEYTRAVSRDGNLIAQTLISETMEMRERFEWRGLGEVANSALKIKSQYADFDAELRFNMPVLAVSEQKGCECPSVLRGTKRPTDCKLFGTVCRPDNPLGACMVSSEGSCAAYWSYARNKTQPYKDECTA